MTVLRLPDQLGLIGDVHAQDHVLASALELLASQGAERMLCTGDVVDGDGDADRAVELLRAADVVVARGNHDRWWSADEMRDLPHAHGRGQISAANAAWLRDLPAQVRASTSAGPLLLCHGIGDDDMNRYRIDDDGYALEVNEELHALLGATTPPSVVVKGHTHRAGVATIRGIHIVDAGTLRVDHDPVVSLLDL